MIAIADPEEGDESLDQETVHGVLGDQVREVYYTDSGREVYGGGGINPDLVVRQDTLFTVERDFRSELGEDIPVYSDAVFRFAVEYFDAHKNLRVDFQITSRMLDDLYDWLDGAGIEIDRALYDGGSRLISRDLGIQLATVAFDEEDSTRRRLVLDRQVETAAELLREGRTQSRLFALAEAREDEVEPQNQN